MKGFIGKGGIFHLKTPHKQSPWSEPKIIIVSFVSILLPASVLLTLPLFSQTGLSFVDALFTATSAISVTGLGVVDTGTHFTHSGKVLLMILMQIGGLGQMTLSAVLLYLFGARLSLKQQAVTKGALGQESSINIRRLVILIMLFTLIAEMIGTIILAIRWVPEFGLSEGLFTAVFHAISAFNNAGFSLFSDSMTRYQDDTLLLMTISLLFICGGLGFTVVADLFKWSKTRHHKLRLHSKLMLVATPVLLLSGTLLFWVLEKNNPATLGHLPTGLQWMNAFFQSATARTAGFNSVDIAQFSQPAFLVMMALMLIGAGSTSTGGGIKVSTFVVAILATITFLRQQNNVVLFKRTIAWNTVLKCLAIIVVSGLILILAMFLLMLTEKASFDRVMFETISAFSTAGLSAGLSASLSEPGKVIMVVVMITGRIGPLTLAYLLARPTTTQLKYPEDNVYAG